MIKINRTIPDIETEKRQLYFKYLYPISLIPFIFFFIRLVIVYHDYRYNFFFSIIFFSLMFLVPLLNIYFKKYYASILLYFTTIILAAVFLIFIAGGFEAPGFFWISVIPLMGTAMLGRKGALLGFGYLVLTLIVFEFIPTPKELIPSIFIHDPTSFYQERKINFYIFNLFCLVFAYVYFRLETKNVIDLKKEKEANESLLRILFHDITNPAFAINLKASHSLSKEHLDIKEHEEVLLAIQKSSKQLLDVLEQVRSFKALKDGKNSVVLDWFKLSPSLKELQEIMTDKLKEKSISMEINGNNSEIEIFGNNVLFVNQILVNVLTNAIKFSPDFSTIKIEVQLQEDHQICKLIIRDQGIGMPNEILKNLFSDNFQTSRHGLKGEKGTGYGMSIVKFIIEKFQGEIKVYSKEASDLVGENGTIVEMNFKSRIK